MSNQEAELDQVSLGLEPKLKTRLEDFSAENGVSQAGAVRMALNQFLPEGTNP